MPPASAASSRQWSRATAGRGIGFRLASCACRSGSSRSIPSGTTSSRHSRWPRPRTRICRKVVHHPSRMGIDGQGARGAPRSPRLPDKKESPVSSVPTSGERAARPRGTTARSDRRSGDDGLNQGQLDRLVQALAAAADGDFSGRLRADGPMADVAAAFNALVERNQQVTKELIRVSKVVGREGRINERASVAGAPGSWSEKLGAVNELIDNLARPTIEVARVIDAVADGDLTQRIQLEIDGQPVRGEFRRIGTTVNAMVDQLSSFAAEVTRVAREVGTEGILGGQAKVKGVSGTWKDLTDNVNQMANNLTQQVRNIADVTTAVANGNLTKKITVDVKGEVLELKNTINTMVDQLSS